MLDFFVAIGKAVFCRGIQDGVCVCVGFAVTLLGNERFLFLFTYRWVCCLMSEQ